jgi:hypothetical protein
MSYVDAGYIAALGAMFVYGVGLVLRRRRWERARQVARSDAGVTPATDASAAPAAPGGHP